MTDRDKLLANNQFIVTVGPLVYSFSSVTNISDSMEVEVVQEGGVNLHPQMLWKPKTKLETIVLERGIQIGAGGLQDRLLTTGMTVLVVTIMVMNRKEVSKVYFFDEGIITKWEVGNLNAMGKDILIRKVEITHTGLHELA